MTIFGIGPESFWFWILCAAGSWALVLMVRVAGAVIASLRDDLRAIRNPPECEMWEAAMDDRVRPEHRAMGTCKQPFGDERQCGLRYATETDLPRGDGIPCDVEIDGVTYPGGHIDRRRHALPEDSPNLLGGWREKFREERMRQLGEDAATLPDAWPPENES